MANYYKPPHAHFHLKCCQKWLCLDSPPCSCHIYRFKCGNAQCVLVHMQVQSVPFYVFAIFDSECASALMGCRRRWPNRVKVVQETTSVTAVRGMMSGCQDCFAESLSLLVDLLQQTPNTTANLCMHLWGRGGHIDSVGVRRGIKEKISFVMAAFLSCIVLSFVLPAQTCSWEDFLSPTNYFLTRLKASSSVTETISDYPHNLLTLTNQFSFERI